jgi:hypothetical protein
LPAAAALLPSLLSWQRAAILVLWLRVIFRYYNRVARSNFPVIDLVLSIFALPVFAAMLFVSWQRVTVRKEVRWKGREYRV